MTKYVTYNIHVIGPVGDDSKRFFDAARSQINVETWVDNYISSSVRHQSKYLQYSLFCPISLNAYALNTRWACPHAFIIVYNAHQVESFALAINKIVPFVAGQLALIGSSGMRCIGVLIANRRNDEQPHGIKMDHARAVAEANNLLFYDLNSDTEPEKARAIIHAIARCCDEAFETNVADTAAEQAQTDPVVVQDGCCHVPTSPFIVLPARALYCATAVCFGIVVGSATAVLFGIFTLTNSLLALCEPSHSRIIRDDDMPIAQSMQDFEVAKMDPRRASEIAPPPTKAGVEEATRRSKPRQIDQTTRVYLEYS